MAWFAFLVVPRASGASGPTVNANLASAVFEWVKQIRELPVPDEIAEKLLGRNVVTRRVAAEALRIAYTNQKVRELVVLIEPLEKLKVNPPSEFTSIKLQDEPDKAAKIYRVR